MIISASRRTDIPCYYSDWLLGRIEAGYALTRNPFNPAQTKRVSLLPEDVDCFVFWTKDPQKMLSCLPFLDSMGYRYYFQFTLTPYGNAIEKNLRGKSEILKTFITLSEALGKERVLWRYDPIILGGELDIPYHRKAFEKLCGTLSEYTALVTISFLDMYSKLKSELLREIQEAEMHELAAVVSEIAGKFSLPVKACCESLDLSAYGIQKAACIDRELIESISGHPIAAKADKNQRANCGCVESTDIGAYSTCENGCVYCYANKTPALAARNRLRHDPSGEALVEL